MITSSEAVEKIRKLLNRNGRTEAEADTASILAAALAEKHGIDIAGIDQADEQRRIVITHKVMGEWTNCPPEAHYAASICKDYFEISPLTVSGWIEYKFFIGTERHIQVAEYVFKFLLHEFRWQWNKKRGRCKKRKQFIWGCYLALDRKLHSRFATPEGAPAGLEVSWKAKRAAYIKEQWGETTSNDIAPKEKGGAALQRGFQAGRDIDIRQGVAGGNQKQPEALPGWNNRLLEASNP